MEQRMALVAGEWDKPADIMVRVNNYMPNNYSAEIVMGNRILITGTDVAGWTLDGYVIPRLASGLIFAEELREVANLMEGER